MDFPSAIAIRAGQPYLPFYAENKSCPASTLPTETWIAIFEYIQPSVLTRIMQTHRLWHSIAERILYTTIAISENLDNHTVTNLRTARCCETIVEHAHLLTVIRAFHVRWHGLVDERRQPFIIHTLEVMFRVLETASQLESLELCLAGYAGPLHEVLENCAFPALRQFSLAGTGTTPLSKFLHAHPTIVHLHLNDHASHPPLEPEDLPLLHTFRGYPATASSFVPGRPISCIGLTMREPQEIQLSEFAARTTAPIRVLDLGSVYTTPAQLVLIAKHLLDIEVLRVRLALRHTLHYALSGIMWTTMKRLLAGLTEVLRRFHNLTTLDLSPTKLVSNVDGIAEGISPEELSLCSQWGRVCLRLRRIIFPSGTEWTLVGDRLWQPLHTRLSSRP